MCYDAKLCDILEVMTQSMLSCVSLLKYQYMHFRSLIEGFEFKFLSISFQKMLRNVHEFRKTEIFIQGDTKKREEIKRLYLMSQ